jgi:hypothetical protein
MSGILVCGFSPLKMAHFEYGVGAIYGQVDEVNTIRPVRRARGLLKNDADVVNPHDSQVHPVSPGRNQPRLGAEEW